MKVSPDEVAKRFPDQPGKTLAAIASILSGIAIGSMDWMQAQELGLSLQREYGALVQRLLDVASSDVARTAPQHLARLLQVLQECAEDFNPTSTMGGWLRKDKPRAVDVNRIEIQQLRAKLIVCMGEFDAPVRQLMDIRAKLASLNDSLMALSLACDWLRTRSDLPDEVRSVLADRTLSLVKTAVMVQQQQVQSLATAGQYDALRDRIQDAVLIALPTWLATLASQPMSLTETQRFVVRDDLRQIIHRLKT